MVKEISIKTYNQVSRFKCPVDFISNLETEFYELRLVGLAVQNNVKCPNSPVSRRGLLDVRYKTCVLTSPEEKYQRGHGKFHAGCCTWSCLTRPVLLMVTHKPFVWFVCFIDIKSTEHFQSKFINVRFLFDLLYPLRKACFERAIVPVTLSDSSTLPVERKL